MKEVNNKLDKLTFVQRLDRIKFVVVGLFLLEILELALKLY